MQLVRVAYTLLDGGRVKNTVVWITGEPAAGKTTVAEALRSFLAKRDEHICLLEGEEIRRKIGSWDFSPNGRAEHVKRTALMAAMLAPYYPLVVCALVSPSAEARQHARWIADRHSVRFLEVHVACSESVLAARRSIRTEFKYEKVPYEAPEHPDLLLDTGALSPSRCVEALISKL